MKYATVLLALAVVCLLAAPALAAHNGNCNGNCNANCNGDCIRDCQNVPPQDGTGNQYGNGQNGNPDGQAQDGKGPLRDGSCRT